MFASRASRHDASTLTPRASVKHLPPGATLLHESWLARDVRWIIALSLFYVLAVVAATLALNPYFSQTWDVVTFVKAARTFLDGSWPSLYAQSRAAQTWPYAYPPLHALIVAPFLALPFPDYLMARVPPLLADVGVGLLLYSIIARRTADKNLSRLALAVWLLNPVTFYDTAVQGHFEAEWLFFVLLAYLLAETSRLTPLPRVEEGRWLAPILALAPTLALAIAFLFKQTAILFAIPYWALLLFQSQAPLRERMARLAASVGIWALVVFAISLPFLFYSGDYLYMIGQYVASVPLQTQSWLVALSPIFSPDFFLLQSSSILVLLAALVVSFFAIRRGASLYLIAIFITLAFFLLSKKVVGYYYVMLLPFALIEFLPARRFALLALIVAATAWISLSPYFASWANQSHWLVYAALGALNSLLWLVLFVWLWRPHPHPLSDSESAGKRFLIFLSIVLFLEAVAASLLQPLVVNQTSPIRAPLIPNGSETNAAFASALMLTLTVIALAAASYFARRFASNPTLPRAAYALAVIFVPLYFLTFTLTKESTTALEVALKSLGF